MSYFNYFDETAEIKLLPLMSLALGTTLEFK